uniref:Myosin motor domain-containing protein n=1 Tax=Parascaris equorum TaxID=6256 RepID=A0A914RIS7_PAREQ
MYVFTVLQKSDLHDGLVDDYADFQKLRSALLSIGLNANDLNNVFQIIAALLHLGNVHFVDNADDRKGIQICGLSYAK